MENTPCNFWITSLMNAWVLRHTIYFLENALYQFHAQTKAGGSNK